MSQGLVIPQGSILDEEAGILQLCIDGAAAFTSAGIPIPYLKGGEGNSADDADDDDDDDDDDDADDAEGAADKSKSGKEGDSKPDPNSEDTSGLKSALEKQKRLRRAARQERDAIRAELDQLKNKDLPELEQVRGELKTVTDERNSLKAERAQHVTELAFLKSNAGITWHDPEDALVHVRRELADLLDDDDEIDTAQVKQIAIDLAKRKPYLVKSEGDTKSGKKDPKDSNSDGSPDGKTAGGGTGTRERKDAGKHSPEKLREMYPALRK